MVNPADWEYKKAIKILGISHGFTSNIAVPIHNPSYFKSGDVYSQITNWEVIEETRYSSELDSYCFLLDAPDQPFEIRIEGNELFVQGNIAQLEKEAKDHRWSLLGNVGLWTRHALATQERQGIFSLHAAAIYRPTENELIIVVGKAGVGKTVFLLEAISQGQQVFSTEMTYFHLTSDGIKFYRGALSDNIRAGTLIYDFPDAVLQMGIEPPVVENPWDHKVSIDLRPFSAPQSELDNPTLFFVFPKIDRDIEQADVRDISDRSALTNLLFMSAAEKISGTFLLYGSIPTVSFDTSELAAKRWDAVAELVAGAKWDIKGAKSTRISPGNFMEGIDL